jgi:hypothetical protein
MPAYDNIPVNVSGTWQPSVPSVKVSGVWVPVTEGWVNVSGTWQQFYAVTPPVVITVTITPGIAYGARLGAGTVDTNSVTASASGGTGPYTYLWEYISGDTEINVITPTVATVVFRATVGIGDIFNATFRVTATDSLGNTGTQTISATLAETT